MDCSLMRQDHKKREGLEGVDLQIGPDFLKVELPSDPGRPVDHITREGDVDRKRQYAEGGYRPEQRRSGHPEPAGDQEDQHEERRQRSPQIVKDLPAGEKIQRVPLLAVPLWNPLEKPARNLPVATDPAVIALAVAGVGGRKIVKKLNSGCKSRSQVGARSEERRVG